MVIGWQLPDSVHVFRQYDDGVDLERMIGAGLSKGFAECGDLTYK